MSNVINLFENDDIEYITGSYNEPTIVGVKTGFGSIELAPDLHGVLVGGNWITREEFIAFIFATDIWCDIKKVIKENEQ